jgi:hypothetical protein
MSDDLVARYDGELGICELAIDDMKIRPAYRAGRDPDPHLAGAGCARGQLHGFQRVVWVIENHGMHVVCFHFGRVGLAGDNARL